MRVSHEYVYIIYTYLQLLIHSLLYTCSIYVIIHVAPCIPPVVLFRKAWLVLREDGNCFHFAKQFRNSSAEPINEESLSRFFEKWIQINTWTGTRGSLHGFPFFFFFGYPIHHHPGSLFYSIEAPFEGEHGARVSSDVLDELKTISSCKVVVSGKGKCREPPGAPCKTIIPKWDMQKF